MIERFVFAQLGRLCCLLMALSYREKSFQSQTQIISSVWEISLHRGTIETLRDSKSLGYIK